MKKKAKEETIAIMSGMTPTNKDGSSPLGLPPLLEKRRIKHGIPDNAFACRPVFDRVFVWQIWVHQEETFLPGGNIVQPANYREGDLRENPHGIVVGAGLSALDYLRSNGIDLGHHVSIIHVQPWRMPVGIKDSEGVLMLQAGDCTGSFDLEANLRAGNCRIVTKKNEHGQRIHQFVDESGEIWDPVTAPVWDDM